MNRQEFARRRKCLMDMMNTESVAILPTSPVRIRNRDVEFPFRAESNFYYLTGFKEPDAVAVLVPDREQGEFILFCREKDPEMETWHGRRAGLEGACEFYGADDAFPIEDIGDIVPGLMENKERVFYSMGLDKEFDQNVMRWVNQIRDRSRTGVTAPGEFVALDHLIHEMRLFKSKAEIKAMRKAAEISVGAHIRAMRAVHPGATEYQIEAEILHEFMHNGARSSAYPSIVGGGENGCILHYTENDAVLNDKELLLIDAGAEYDSYASDITRTFPINGKFSKAQKQIYELVLAAQRAAIKTVKPGAHWNEPHEAAVKVLTAGLVELGILKGKLNQHLLDETYKTFYMHRTGHWLGMDVHDVGDYKVAGEWRMLEAGMVLTVEPGLYFTAGTKGLARKWWNIGVRIEDDVLVTADGCEVLSAGAPKTVEEIEEVMSNARAA